MLVKCPDCPSHYDDACEQPVDEVQFTGGRKVHRHSSFGIRPAVEHRLRTTEANADRAARERAITPEEHADYAARVSVDGIGRSHAAPVDAYLPQTD